MLFDKEKILIIADYIRITYDDDTAYRKLEAFLAGVDIGWREGIVHSAQYVNSWHSNMDSMHESITKGLLSEIEGGIRELEFGDV